MAAAKRPRMKPRICQGCKEDRGTEGPLPHGWEADYIGPGEWRFTCPACVPKDAA